MSKTAITALLLIVHLGSGAAWLGAMTYSLFVVQPRARRHLGDARAYEGLAVELAAGARWKVLAVAAALGLSGIGLTVVALTEAGNPSGGWLALVVAKLVLLLVAVGLFARVSWSLWPRRLFATDRELESVQRQFRRSAIAIAALIGAGLVLGAVASAIGPG